MVCQSTARKTIYVLDFGRIVECSKCGLVYAVTPDGADLVECEYGEQYYKNEGGQIQYGYPDYFGKEREARVLAARVFVQVIGVYRKNVGKLLDVGCGGGYFVHAALASGWDAVGIDKSDYAIQMASKLVGGHVLPGELKDYSSTLSPATKFDVVTMFDVIEHVRNPVEQINLAVSLLSAGGVVVLTTPTYGGKFSTGQGANYVQFKQDHIYHFSIRTMEELLRRTDVSGWDIYQLADVLQSMKGDVPDEVLNKYQNEREHMLVVCRR
jgi:2-polyprenyl-3-methyl-5-hydroxy-6-metoxy-1,4-benzoquinol methylase